MVNGRLGVGAMSTVALSMAALVCAAMLFGDPDGLGLVARVAATGLCFVLAWMLTRRAALGPGEPAVWRHFGRAAAWVGVALRRGDRRRPGDPAGSAQTRRGPASASAW